MNNNRSTAELILDRAALWGALRLTASQVARVSGATRRMVQHWTALGHLPTTDGEYTTEAVEICTLLVQARKQDVTLRRAVHLVGLYREAHNAEFGLFDVQPATLSKLHTNVVHVLVAVQDIERQMASYVTAEQGHDTATLPHAAD